MPALQPALQRSPTLSTPTGVVGSWLSSHHLSRFVLHMFSIEYTNANVFVMLWRFKGMTSLPCQAWILTTVINKPSIRNNVTHQPGSRTGVVCTFTINQLCNPVIHLWCGRRRSSGRRRGCDERAGRSRGGAERYEDQVYSSSGAQQNTGGKASM